MNTRTKKVHVYSNGCVPNRLEGKKITDSFSQQGCPLEGGCQENRQNHSF